MISTHIKSFAALLITLCSFTAHAQIIRTISGTGPCPPSATSGTGGQARLAPHGNPHGMAVDTLGNVYVTDNTFHIVKKISPNGIISIFAGTGFPIFSGDGGPATSATIANPSAIIIDPQGNFYLGDAGNKVVRKINPAGIISTYAGHPGSSSIGGDGGPATDAGLGSVSGLTLDAAGNLYIADGNTRVRKVNKVTGIITTVVGSGSIGNSGNGGPATDATFDGICDIAIDAAGNMYVTDKNNNLIRKVNTAGIVSLYAGNGTAGFNGEGGPATAARLYQPSYIKFDKNGVFYFSDQGNNRIRKINAAGIITTAVGLPTGSGASVIGFAGDGGSPTLCKTNAPTQFCYDSRGNMFLADKGAVCSPSVNAQGHRVREIFTVDTFSLTVAPGNTLCGNTAATYTAHPRYGGYYSYVYRWKVNGLPIGPNGPVYASTTVHNNDTVTCTIVDTAEGGMLLAISDTIYMTVLPPIPPSVTVTSTGDTLCAGLPVTFTATAINGGTAPLFEWYVNGVLRGTGVTFTYIPLTGDIVTCKLTSNDPCAFPITAHVDRPMSIIPSFQPDVTVVASPSATISYWGQIVTFFTNLTYEGTAPTFQWYNNHGPIAGATTATYNQTIYAADTIFCVMHSNGYCAVPAIDTSNIVYIGTGTLDVNDMSAQPASFSIFPNPNNGHFTIKGTAHNLQSGNITIEIKNVLGQVVYKTTIRPTNGSIELPIDLNKNIPSGMYYLITGDDRGNRATPFVVK